MFSSFFKTETQTQHQTTEKTEIDKKEIEIKELEDSIEGLEKLLVVLETSEQENQNRNQKPKPPRDNNEPREYVQPPLSLVDKELGSWCQKGSKPKEYNGSDGCTYHCEALNKLLFCAANQHQYPNDPQLKSLCREGNHLFEDGDYYHSNYHIEQLCGLTLFNPIYKDFSERINFQRKFAKVYDDLQENGYKPEN